MTSKLTKSLQDEIADAEKYAQNCKPYDDNIYSFIDKTKDILGLVKVQNKQIEGLVKGLVDIRDNSSGSTSQLRGKVEHILNRYDERKFLLDEYTNN